MRLRSPLPSAPSAAGASAIAIVVAATACGSSGAAPAAADGVGHGDGAAASSAGDAAGDSPASAAEASGPPQEPSDAALPADAALLGEAGMPRSFTVVNSCAQTVWAAALPATTFPGGVVQMAPGASFQVGVDNGWSGRIWGKVQCATTAGKLACASDAFPSSLAELTLTKTDAGLDFYDVSLVDGFNLPIALMAVGHSPDPAHPYDCGNPSCAVDLNATCPAVLADSVDGGAAIACANDECRVLGGNDAGSPDCTYPNQYTEFFKTACPTAYSYPYDDPTSTFTCKGFNDYAVVFCP